MEFDFYRNFITIAETGNITAAARKLSLAQPALSAQLRTIEQRYKIKLLKTSRGQRRVELTAAGEVFLQKAKKICLLEDDLLTEMHNYQNGSVGRLSFAVSPGTTELFLEKYLNLFAGQYPEIVYNVYEVDVSMQVKYIEEGICDFAFANAPLSKADSFNLCRGQKESFYAVYAADNIMGFAPESEIVPESLKGIPVSCNFSCRRMLADICSKCGFALQVRYQSTTARSALLFAAAGNSVAVVPESILQELPGGMRRQKISHAGLYFEQALFWEKDTILTNCAERFLGFYRNIK